MQKKGIVWGAISSTVFGAITLFAFFNEHANRLFGKPLGLLAYPIERLVGKLVNYNDAYLGVLYFVDFIYMLAIGFLLGFILHKFFFRAKKKTTSRD